MYLCPITTIGGLLSFSVFGSFVLYVTLPLIMVLMAAYRVSTHCFFCSVRQHFAHLCQTLVSNLLHMDRFALKSSSSEDFIISWVIVMLGQLSLFSLFSYPFYVKPLIEVSLDQKKKESQPFNMVPTHARIYQVFIILNLMLYKRLLIFSYYQKNVCCSFIF